MLVELAQLVITYGWRPAYNGVVQHWRPTSHASSTTFLVLQCNVKHDPGSGKTFIRAFMKQESGMFLQSSKDNRQIAIQNKDQCPAWQMRRKLRRSLEGRCSNPYLRGVALA